MANTVTVGIADLNVVKSPDTLITYALGSCIGICLYDSAVKVAGLAHIMLPLSTEATQGGGNKRRYADTGIAELIQKMNAQGAMTARMTAKIAGGAQMFSVNSAVFNIGERNVAAVKKVLASYNIRIIAEETGSNYGRTQLFHADTGAMEIRAATKQTKMY